MKQVDFSQPELLLKVFAEDGTRNTLPLVNTDTSNPQKADLTNGFPTDTEGDPLLGKLPPERADFNALGYLTTSYDFFYQAGGVYTFNSTVSTAIGGYPKGARLWYQNADGVSMILRSTKDDNTDNFNSDSSYIGTSWVIETFAGIENSSINLLDYKYVDKIINKMSWAISDNNWLYKSAYLSAYTHLSDDIGFIVRNDSGTVKIAVSCTDYIAGDYIRSAVNDVIVSGTTYYAWGYSTDLLYVTLDTSSMSADDAVSALQGQRIYKYENPTISLTIHKITTSTTDSYEINGNTITLNVLVGSDEHRIVLMSSNEDEDIDTIYNGLGYGWYYILDKTNERFKLPRAKHREIIETYTSGTDWYIVWSDGFCEQGGYNSSNTTITFLKPFSNTNYNIQVTDKSYAVNGSQKTNINSYTTTQLVLSAQNQTGHWWKCSGYISNVIENSQYKYLYFYVGEYSDTAIQQTAGITASTINAKMDSDISNITTTGKEAVCDMVTPDYTAGISKSWNTDITAESSGVVIAHDSAQWSSPITVTVNSVTLPFSDIATAGNLSISFIVGKGDVWKVSGGDNSGRSLVFYPMKGVV